MVKDERTSLVFSEITLKQVCYKLHQICGNLQLQLVQFSLLYSSVFDNHFLCYGNHENYKLVNNNYAQFLKVTKCSWKIFHQFGNDSICFILNRKKCINRYMIALISRKRNFLAEPIYQGNEIIQLTQHCRKRFSRTFSTTSRIKSEANYSGKKLRLSSHAITPLYLKPLFTVKEGKNELTSTTL